jgi:hypothetical protein
LGCQAVGPTAGVSAAAIEYRGRGGGVYMVRAPSGVRCHWAPASQSQPLRAQAPQCLPCDAVHPILRMGKKPGAFMHLTVPAHLSRCCTCNMLLFPRFSSCTYNPSLLRFFLRPPHALRAVRASPAPLLYLRHQHHRQRQRLFRRVQSAYPEPFSIPTKPLCPAPQSASSR